MQHNPYQPPAAASEPPPQERSLDDLVAATSPTVMVRVAAAFCAVLGAMVALVGLQFAGVIAVVPYAMMAGGAATIFVSAKLYQTRLWAAIAAIAVGALVMLGMGLWVLLALGAGVVSFLAVLTVLVAPAVVVLASVALGPCLRAARARRRLREELAS
jgi:hypothetical protein